MSKNQTIRANLSEAEKVLEKERAYLADLRADYAASVGSADDDELDDLEEQTRHYETVVSRAEARIAALGRDLAKAEVDGRKDVGDAANQRADAYLAPAPALMAEAMQHAEQIALIAGKLREAIKASEPERRLAHHHGVTPTPATLSTPDIGPALEGLRLLSRLPGAIWRTI